MGHTVFSALLAHHMYLRSQASLALTEQLDSQLRPLDARADAIDKQIDQLPDGKYQDGAPAERASKRLYNELHPIQVQKLAAKQALLSTFWSRAQLVYNRNFWWITPLLFGGWLWFAVLVPARLRQPSNKALQRTAG